MSKTLTGNWPTWRLIHRQGYYHWFSKRIGRLKEFRRFSITSSNVLSLNTTNIRLETANLLAVWAAASSTEHTAPWTLCHLHERYFEHFRNAFCYDDFCRILWHTGLYRNVTISYNGLNTFSLLANFLPYFPWFDSGPRCHRTPLQEMSKWFHSLTSYSDLSVKQEFLSL